MTAAVRSLSSIAGAFWDRIGDSRSLRYGGTVVLCVYLALRADLEGVGAILGRTLPEWVGLAVVLYGLDRYLAAVRWQTLFNRRNQTISLGRALTVYLQSSFLGAALPSTVGMDAIRAGLVREDAGGFSYATSSIVVERVLGVAALLVCAVSGLAVFGSRSEWLELGSPLISGLLVLVAAGLVLFFVLLYAGRYLGSAEGILGRLLEFLHELRDDLESFSSRSTVLVFAFLIALLQQYLFIAIHWILALSLGLTIPVAEMLWIWPLVMLAVRLPISILGFGVREVVIYQFFSHGGLSVEQSVSLGLLSGGLSLLFVGLGGLLLVVPFGWLRPEAVQTGRERERP